MFSDNKIISNVLKKIATIMFIVAMLVITALSAAADNIILNDTTYNIEADLLVMNNVTNNIGTLMRWDLNSDNGSQLALNENMSITDARLHLYIVNIDGGGAGDDDIQVCQVTWVGLSETTINPFFFCSLYNNTITTTLSSTTVATWTWFDVTAIIQNWDGSSDIGIRFEDVDKLVNESEDTDQYFDDLTLAIGLGNATASYDFEDRENTNNTGNTPFLNITYYNNTPPNITSVNITSNDGDLNKTNATFTLTYACDDDNGNDCDNYTTYKWFNDTAEIIGEVTSTLASTFFVKGENITGQVIVEDNSGAANNQTVQNSSKVQIQNTLPYIVFNSFINITRPYINATFRVNVSYYDMDLDVVIGPPSPSVVLQFTTNGSGTVSYGFCYNLTNGTSCVQDWTTDYAALGTTKNDYAYIRDSYASDGANGVATNSSEINFTNAPPSVVTVENLPDTVYDGTRVSCSNTVLDIDGDSLDKSYDWYKNGVSQSINSFWLGPGNTTLSEAWLCEVTINDSEFFDRLNSTGFVVTSTGSPSSGSGDDGPFGTPPLGGILPENATFTTTPNDIADLLIAPGVDTTFTVTVISTASTGVSVKLSVIDRCGVYQGYEVEQTTLSEYYTVDGYERLSFVLEIDVPDDYNKEQCSVFVTFISKGGDSDSVEIRLWNTVWSNLLRTSWRVISYPIVFEEDRNSVDFMTDHEFLAFPSAVDLRIPFFGLGVLVFSFVMFRYLLFRYILEFRSKQSRFALFTISLILTSIVAVILSFPIGIGFVSTSIVIGALFVIVAISVGVIVFKLPKTR